MGVYYEEGRGANVTKETCLDSSSKILISNFLLLALKPGESVPYSLGFFNEKLDDVVAVFSFNQVLFGIRFGGSVITASLIPTSNVLSV